MKSVAFATIAAAFVLLNADVLWSASSPSKMSTSAKKNAASARPDESPQTERQLYLDLIDYGNNRLQYLRYDEKECVDCFATGAGTGYSILDTKSPHQICQDKWADFYSKDVIDIRYVFGYADSDVDSLASDTLMRQAMIDSVTAPCKGNVRVCGFTRSEDDADLFEKEIKGPTGRRHTVQLRLTASSASVSDRLNRAMLDQKQQTVVARNTFETGICESDMQIYIGHARGGGGPDFDPARRRANGTTDFDYYRKNTPGLNRMSEVLAKCPLGQSAKILGFLACDSSRWKSRLEREAPKSGLLLSATDNIPMEAALTQSYLALDSVLWMRCEGAFNTAMQQLSEYAGKSVIPPRIHRFFRDDGK